MNITKIKINEMIIISFLIILIYKFCNSSDIVEGLSPTNRNKLKECLKKVIRRDCTNPVKAALLNANCEYGDNNEYIGITCDNNILIDNIICSHLIGQGACESRFGRSIINSSCSGEGVNKKCPIRLRNDSVYINKVNDLLANINNLESQLILKERTLTEKIEEIEKLKEKERILIENQAKIQEFQSEKDKIIQIRIMFKELIEQIKTQTENLDKCNNELSEEKKEELQKIKEKLQSGLITLKTNLNEFNDIKNNKIEQVKKIEEIEEIEEINSFKNMLDSIKNHNIIEKIKENYKIIIGAVVSIIVLIIMYTLNKKYQFIGSKTNTSLNSITPSLTETSIPVSNLSLNSGITR